MKFTFFKRQRVLLPICKKANREFNALPRTELAQLQNFSLFLRGIGGRLGVIWTFGFFGKSKARWNFLFPFLRIVHQKGLLGRIKSIMKFCNCRRILDIYSQCLLKLRRHLDTETYRRMLWQFCNFTCEITNYRWNFALKLRSNSSSMILVRKSLHHEANFNKCEFTGKLCEFINLIINSV